MNQLHELLFITHNNKWKDNIPIYIVFQLLRSGDSIWMISLMYVTTYNKHLSIHQFLILKRFARIEETSIHSFIFIQILVIDLDLTLSNDWGRSTVCRFGISIHDSIIHIKLERVTEQGQKKLYPFPFEVMDDRLGRSEYQIIHHYLPFIINEQESSRRFP